MIASGTNDDLYNQNYNRCPQETYLCYVTLWCLWGVNGIRAKSIGFYEIWSQEVLVALFCHFLRCFEIPNVCHVAGKNFIKT